MFIQPGGFRQRVESLAARFREKGATSPETAMTAQELGLPPRFEQAMQRRLGRTGIFVEVSGKYYLDESKLQQLQQRWNSGAGRGASSGSSGRFALRIARRIVGISAIVLVLLNVFFVRSAYLSVVVLGLVVLWIVLSVYQILFMARARRDWNAQRETAG